MSTLPSIGIILSTTRKDRFADKPASWLLDIARRRADARFELVDLRDYPLPFFDEPRSPMRTPPANEVAKAWGEKVASFDGFVFITAEYNHGISGVLKNALDYTYPQFNRKAAAFMGYGSVGGARAIEQLRLNLVELQVAPLRSAVHLGGADFMGMLLHGKTFADFPQLDTMAGAMLDDLVWWTNTLRAGRTAKSA